MLDKSRILSLIPNEFEKFNNIWARMLHFIYHVTFKKILWNRIFGVECSDLVIMFATLSLNALHNVT